MSDMYHAVLLTTPNKGDEIMFTRELGRAEKVKYVRADETESFGPVTMVFTLQDMLYFHPREVAALIKGKASPLPKGRGHELV